MRVANASSFRFARSSCQIPIPRVREDYPEEERVAPVAEDEGQEAEREENCVERRDRIRPDDGHRRPARGGLPRLIACGVARRRLHFGKACCGHGERG